MAGCGETLMKIVLVVINIVFAIIGVCMLGFGITAKASPKLIAVMFSHIIPEELHEELEAMGFGITDIVVSNSVFMIILGVVVVIVATFGFIGACCMVRWMLVVYGSVLIVVLLAELALIIFAAVYTETLNDALQDSMYYTLSTGYIYGGSLSENGSYVFTAEIIEMGWDSMQFREKCCGAFNYTDYSRQTKWNRTRIFDPLYIGMPVVPLSCCKLKPDISVPATGNDFVDSQKCLDGNPEYLNTNSCYDEVKDMLQDFIKQYKGIAIGIAAAVCVIELVLIIFAFVLCALAGKDKAV